MTSASYKTFPYMSYCVFAVCFAGGFRLKEICLRVVACLCTCRELATTMSEVTGIGKQEILTAYGRYAGSVVTAWKYAARRKYIQTFLFPYKNII